MPAMVAGGEVLSEVAAASVSAARRNKGGSGGSTQSKTGPP